MYKWLDFPYKNDESLGGKYLYAIGGYCGLDDGCMSWGSSNPRDVRFIADEMGSLNICYTDGSVDIIPLIYGYTLWYHSIWEENPAPFFGENTDEELKKLLEDTLCIKGAYEGEKIGVLRIAIQEKPIAEISIKDNPDKRGGPVFYGAYICDCDSEEIFSQGKIDVIPEDVFYITHTVSTSDPYPERCRAALEKICYALHTFEEDFAVAPDKFIYPAAPEGYKISFSGSKLAEIASGVVYYNMINLVERSDDDGFIHTSYKDAPSWRYTGFGPYVPKANSFTHLFYSRDAARAIMTLNSFDHVTKAEAGCGFGNRWMMYYNEQGLRLCGEEIPGHFSVMPNEPMIYSHYLSAEANWPTRYTKELFGEDYRNLGNQETDGHGLMMMANHKVWVNSGKNPQWVHDNWKYINEAARWIVWCYDHPELSFVKNGLLYGETEASLDQDSWTMGWTLYSNIPCYLGMLGYAEMAQSIGDTESYAKWSLYAGKIREGIDADLVVNEKWDLTRCGFNHDPVPTMLSDHYGYDIQDMPQIWIERSNKSYEDDIRQTRMYGMFGRGYGSWKGKGSGIGYDHSMITQNALLLDRMEDASALVNNLSKICYAPRLPEPYIVPEGISVDASKGVLRRQGDLGNLVQLAEAMKCYLLVMGVAPVSNGTLKIMPRLPENWNVSVENFKIQNTDSIINMSVTYPENGKQTANVDIQNSKDINEIFFRFGPFPEDCNEAQVTFNGTTHTVVPVLSGDSKWAWIKL